MNGSDVSGSPVAVVGNFGVFGLEAGGARYTQIKSLRWPVPGQGKLAELFAVSEQSIAEVTGWPQVVLGQAGLSYAALLFAFLCPSHENQYNRWEGRRDE